MTVSNHVTMGMQLVYLYVLSLFNNNIINHVHVSLAISKSGIWLNSKALGRYRILLKRLAAVYCDVLRGFTEKWLL